LPSFVLQCVLREGDAGNVDGGHQSTWATGRQIEAAVNAEEFNYSEALPALFRLRAYEAVHAVLSDDNNFERGVAGARAVAEAVKAEAGTAGLTETVVELALKLAEALERIAAEQGLTAEDLAEVWFVE
jgi:hypothetical protein